LNHRDKKNLLFSLSPHLFWDCNINTIDIRKNRRFIIQRIIAYGTDHDERIMFKLYPFATLKREVVKLDNLDERTVYYLSVVFNVKEERFACFKKKPWYQNS
jgi:hypothetical protein